MNLTMSPPTTTEKAIASFGILLVATSGLLLYVLILVIIRLNKSHFSNPFYNYLVSLGVSDMLMLLIFIFYCIPATIVQSMPLGDVFDRLMGATACMAWYSALPTLLSIGVNRYVAVYYNKQRYSTIYCDANVRINLLLIWLVALVTTAPHAVGYVRLRYIYSQLTWSYAMELPGAMAFTIFEQMFSATVSFSLLIIYGMIVAEVRRQSRQVNAHTNENEQQDKGMFNVHELWLSFQFIPISFYMIVFILAFYIVPVYSSNRWVLYVVTIAYVLNSCLNPVVYLTTNYPLRQQTLYLLRLKEVEPISDTDSMEYNPEGRKLHYSTAVASLYLGPGPGPNRPPLNQDRANIAVVRLKMQEAKNRADVSDTKAGSTSGNLT